MYSSHVSKTHAGMLRLDRQENDGAEMDFWELSFPKGVEVAIELLLLGAPLSRTLTILLVDKCNILCATDVELTPISTSEDCIRYRDS